MSLILDITRNSVLPLTLRKKLGKFINVPEAEDFAIEIFGQDYHGTTNTHLDCKVYRYGMHEASTIRLIRKLLQHCKKNGREAVYVDIGANTGLHMLAVAGVSDIAHGFEPWEKVRLHAERNIAVNNLLHLHLYPFGLSEKDAELPFRLPKGDNLGTGMFLKEGAKADIAFEVREGDRFFMEKDIRPAVIKIDVEGHEKKVLKGLSSTIKKYRPFVIFEYGTHSRKDFRTDRNLSAIFDKGYFYYGIQRSREQPALAPFNPKKKWENILASPVVYENI
ncbi:MAG: FkbM family methyltransferase [Alphaproteobacteria bacterium]